MLCAKCQPCQVFWKQYECCFCAIMTGHARVRLITEPVMLQIVEKHHWLGSEGQRPCSTFCFWRRRLKRGHMACRLITSLGFQMLSVNGLQHSLLGAVAAWLLPSHFDLLNPDACQILKQENQYLTIPQAWLQHPGKRTADSAMQISNADQAGYYPVYGSSKCHLRADMLHGC